MGDVKGSRAVGYLLDESRRRSRGQGALSPLHLRGVEQPGAAGILDRGLGGRAFPPGQSPRPRQEDRPERRPASRPGDRGRDQPQRAGPDGHLRGAPCAGDLAVRRRDASSRAAPGGSDVCGSAASEQAFGFLPLDEVVGSGGGVDGSRRLEAAVSGLGPRRVGPPHRPGALRRPCQWTPNQAWQRKSGELGRPLRLRTRPGDSGSAWRPCSCSSWPRRLPSRSTRKSPSCSGPGTSTDPP